jgi:BirA family biotin operon repressor/biotin-[acetyl-CoA-carboxylase] ligase
MRTLSLKNPFGAPVYWVETTSSTMDESRRLAAEGAAHGAVIGADFQEAGRGRVRDRPWLGRAGENLFATILLRYPGIAAIPPALTLKTGLAMALAIEDFAPALAGLVMVKWPNDIMIRPGAAGAAGGTEAARKAAGILAEGDGKIVYIGFGVNVSQREFPEELKYKAVSIAMARRPAEAAPPPPHRSPADGPVPAPHPDDRLVLLEKVLARLYQELEGAGSRGPEPWLPRLRERLYMRGRQVRFIPGAAGSGRAVEGRLTGIGGGGELLILPNGAGEPLAFTTGELDVYGGT